MVTAPTEPAGLPIGSARRAFRAWTSRLVVMVLARAYLRPRLVGRERLPAGPAVYCFNHMSWADPFVLMAVLPLRPDLWFFGPKEEEMGRGARNRIMSWSGSAIPYKPGKNDLLESTRRVAGVLGSGAVVAIAGEGRIHVGESTLLPLSEGAAYFAIRSGVPLVPLAIRGTSWLRFGGRIVVRVGEPIPTSGRPTREAIRDRTADLAAALRSLVDGAPEATEPGPVGRWLTELFNDWPEGSRAAARAAAGQTASEAAEAAPQAATGEAAEAARLPYSEPTE